LAPVKGFILYQNLSGQSWFDGGGPSYHVIIEICYVADVLGAVMQYIWMNRRVMGFKQNSKCLGHLIGRSIFSDQIFDKMPDTVC
jgi:hypothetical protein